MIEYLIQVNNPNLSQKPANIQVYVLRLTGEIVPVKIDPNATVEMLKISIEVIYSFKQEQKVSSWGKKKI